MSKDLNPEDISSGFATLGMFIIDDFAFADNDGVPTGRILDTQERFESFLALSINDHPLLQIGGGGTYAAIGARIWLPAKEIGMIVDKGYDFPASIEARLLTYGRDMWIFRNQTNRRTTRALNSYRGERRNFEYTTPGIRITPQDLVRTRIPRPRMLHFICSPTRASAIVSEVHKVDGWHPTTIYEPIPGRGLTQRISYSLTISQDRCVPEELPSLIEILPSITILSPNAEEALSLLAMPLPPTPSLIEQAADCLLEYGIGGSRKGWIIIRSGGLGAYVKTSGSQGQWIGAFWTTADSSSKRVVDVTGAGNSFLGGLAAGLLLTGDVIQATFYASVSASFIIEQEGMPTLFQDEVGDSTWNGDDPYKRLKVLLARHESTKLH